MGFLLMSPIFMLMCRNVDFYLNAFAIEKKKPKAKNKYKKNYIIETRWGNERIWFLQFQERPAYDLP